MFLNFNIHFYVVKYIRELKIKSLGKKREELSYFKPSLLLVKPLKNVLISFSITLRNIVSMISDMVKGLLV